MDWERQFGSFFRNITAESGGHQFDASGKPLRSSKGAIGVAQVMPSTGPEAAEAAGLPWDPVRFENDPEYNATVGSAYKAKYKKVFGGDERKANAAYQSGPGTVRSLISRYGDDWERHLGPEGRKYVAKTSGGPVVPGASGGASQMPNTPPVLGLSFLGNIKVDPSTADSETPLISQEDAVSSAQTAFKGIKGDLSKSEEWLNQLSTATQQMQESRRTRVEKTVEAERTLSDAQANETQNLVERTKPLLEARNKEAMRLFNLTQMGGFEKAIKGIFDPNYDEKHVERKIQRMDEALSTLGSNYQFASGLREQLINHLEQVNKGEEAIENLGIQELDETGKVIMQGLTFHNNSLATVNDAVNTQGNLIRAHALQVDDYVSQRSPAELQTLLGQAIKSGGYITADGVKLSVGELRQRLMGATQQEMAFKGQQLALQSNELGFADQMGEHWARYASLTQLQAAAAHGGEYNGMKIPQAAITREIADRQQQHDLMAGEILKGDPVTQLSNVMTAASEDIRVTGTRMATVFGGGEPPREVKAAWDEMNRLGDAAVAAIRQAKKSGITAEVAAPIVQQFQKVRENYNGMVDKIAIRYAGGDQKIGGYLASYLKGEPLDQGAANEAMLAMIDKGGIPSAMRVTPSAQKAFAAAKAASDAAIASMQGKPGTTQQQLKAARLEAISKAVPMAYNDAGINDFIGAMPEIAQKLGHPFAGVSQQEFGAARRAGDTNGYTRIAGLIGVTPQDAALIFGGQKQADPATQKKIDAHGGFSQLRNQLGALQQQGFLDALDRLPSAGNLKDRPSRLFADLVNNPKVQQLAGVHDQLQTQSSFGDFISQSGSRGAFQQQFGLWGQNLNHAVHDSILAENVKGSGNMAKYNLDPVFKATVVLNTMDELSQQERAALVHVIKSQVGESWGLMDAGSKMEAMNSLIKGTKFQNPNLERIRKIAAKNWDQASQVVGAAFEAANQ